MIGASLSLSEARRISLASQGLEEREPATIDGIASTIRRLGLLQLDFVNVLVPAHYTVLYARLGPYSRDLLHEAVFGQRQFTEQWAREASLIPVETWPLLRHRMIARRVRPFGFETFLQQNPDYVAWVLEEVKARGPLLADSLPHPAHVARRLPETWVGTVPRAVLEEHLARGRVAVARRLPNFARLYDLAERVIPAAHLVREVAANDADRELVRTAARNYGVATVSDLADYWRMSVREARPRVEELVQSGELELVRVEDWREQAYLDVRAVRPSRVDAATLLAPFDPVVWFRPRVARLFGFEYRFEIFVPPAKRRWGCYVLPFLLGDRLVARVDLKADRLEGRLLVQSALLEPGIRAREVRPALVEELQKLAAWLGLRMAKSSVRLA